MRWAAWRRNSAQVRTGPGAGRDRLAEADPGEAGMVSSGGAAAGETRAGAAPRDSPGAAPRSPAQPARIEQAATVAPRARRPAAMASRSVQGTIDFLGEFMGDAFDGREILDACVADAARPAEALQEFRAFLGSDAGDLLEPARAGADAGPTRPHSGDREAVRFVANLCDEHERRRVAAEPDFRPAVGEDELLEADFSALALLDADDARGLDAELLADLARDADLALAAVDQDDIGKARPT